MLKRILILVLVFTVCFSLVACSSSKATQNPGQTDQAGSSVETDSIPTYKVGLAWATMDFNMTYLIDHISAYLESQEDMNFEIARTSAEGNTTKHISDIEDLVSRGCDLIYIMPEDADGIAPAVDAAVSAGVLFGVGRAVSTDTYTYRYQACENTAPGEMQAEWLIDYANANPDREFYVAHVGGVSTNQTAIDRRNGFYDTLMAANLDNIQWVVEQSCEYSTELAQSTMEGWLLSHPEINTVACANDNMAMGVANAYISSGITDYVLLGIDGNDIGLDLLREGRMAMTVKMDNDRQAEGAAKAIIAALTGNIVTTGPFKLAYGGTKEDFYINVDANNIADY